MGRKKIKHLKRIGFKRGSASPVKGKSFTFKKPCSSAKYVRLNRQSYKARIQESKNATLTFRDVDGAETFAKPLRPLRNEPKLVDSYRAPHGTEVHPDLLTNKLYQPLAVQNMFNSEIKMHMKISPKCAGDLEFDAENSRKWGICWSERLKCTKCTYLSEFVKLFDEAKTNKRGRKAAKANIGIQLGLKSTQISNSGARRILMYSNIIPPQQSGMQKQSNKVGKSLMNVNKESMRMIRENIMAENAKCGHKQHNLVRAEGDSRYNNPIFNSENTPFQSATQVTTLICENNTRKKQIIGAFTGNKLCRKASMLRNKGITVECPHHEGTCTANLTETEVIGNEEKWTSAVTEEINENLQISHFTSDGDSKSYKGLVNSQGTHPEKLRDLRHMANSLKRELYKTPFSPNMLRGTHKINLKSRFSLSVRARVLAELNKAHLKYNGDLQQIIRAMPKVINTVILCFKGSCGSECSKYSLVCNGNFQQKKLYLPSNCRINMTETDENLLRSCIKILLGENNLKLTKFLTSTQKCESVNRALQVSNPKSTTFSRNFSARIHAQILRQNLGLADTIVHSCKEAGAEITKGSSVIKHILSDERKIEAARHASCIKRAKLKRCRSRQRKYKLHENLHYSKGISDPKPDFSQ